MSDLPPATSNEEVANDERRTEPEDGPTTEARLFFLFGAFSLFLAVVYLVWTSRSAGGTEWAGGIALLFAAGFALFFGTFLLLSLRRVQETVVDFEANEEAGVEDTDEVLYLPVTSLWPVGIGVGASLTIAGVALGFWVMIPGIALFVQSIVGFAHQSRARR